MAVCYRSNRKLIHKWVTCGFLGVPAVVPWVKNLIAAAQAAAVVWV